MNEQEQQLVERFMAARKDSAKREVVEDFLAVLVGADDAARLAPLFVEARGDKASRESVEHFLRELRESAGRGGSGLGDLKKKMQALESAHSALEGKVSPLEKVPQRVEAIEKTTAQAEQRLATIEQQLDIRDKVRLDLEQADEEPEFYPMLHTLLARNKTVGIDASFDPTKEFTLCDDAQRGPYVAFVTIAGLLRANGIESPYLRDPRLRNLADRLRRIGFIGEPGGASASEFTKRELMTPITELKGALTRPPLVLAGEDPRANKELRTWLETASREAAAYGAVLELPHGLRLVRATDLTKDVTKDEFMKAADDDRFRCAAGTLRATRAAAPPAPEPLIRAAAGHNGNGGRANGANGITMKAPGPGRLYAVAFDVAITDATREYATHRELHDRTFIAQLGHACPAPEQQHAN